jgi:hypothetical protein
LTGTACLVVGERTIEGFHVDRLCTRAERAEPTEERAGSAPRQGIPAQSPTFIFFFDHMRISR